jgi:methionyl-tRNA synthetase
MSTTFVTTAIPYVNGEPHLGHALELVQADVLARHRRLRGDAVRLQTGTDDNALKNVDAAHAAGVPVADLLRANADRFQALFAPLQVAPDDVIRTSADRRHRPGVERLWRACAAAGDLYPRTYEGLYCTGCESFLAPADLVDGRCPEHAVAPEPVAERNWFFRLSRHQEPIARLIAGGRLDVQPQARRNEVLAFVRGGLDDFSVSRSAARAHGWGIPVPDDPGQVIYVWFDALANYVTALGFGRDGAAYDRWWRSSDARVHVIGKGIVRFHAVYWIAILLSAGEPLPTRIAVHDYLTLDGRKLSKSLGNGADPLAVVAETGVDALRWWLVRDVPTAGDADVRLDRLRARGDELADGLGNLVARTLALVARARPAGVPTQPRTPAAHDELRALAGALPAAIDAALERFDLRAATAALWELVGAANRHVATARPWELAARERAGEATASAPLDAELGLLLDVCEVLGRELQPFLPEAAGRVQAALRARDVALARTLFAKADGRAAR